MTTSSIFIKGVGTMALFGSSDMMTSSEMVETSQIHLHYDQHKINPTGRIGAGRVTKRESKTAISRAMMYSAQTTLSRAG